MEKKGPLVEGRVSPKQRHFLSSGCFSVKQEEQLVLPKACPGALCVLVCRSSF